MSNRSFGVPSYALITTALSVLAIGATADVATPTKEPFNGYLHFCGSTAPEKVIQTPGGTLHIRGATNENRWDTGNPLIDGQETNTVIVNFSHVTGKVRAQMTLLPDAYPGSSWEITQTLHFRPDGSVPGKGVGHGTGALRGMTIKFNAGDLVFGHNTCSTEPSALLTGVILAPADVG
jgi:hypothetical protein